MINLIKSKKRGAERLRKRHLTAKEIRIDGNPLPPGVYGGEDAPAGVNKTYAAHFSGTGTIRVAGAFMLMIR